MRAMVAISWLELAAKKIGIGRRAKPSADAMKRSR